MELLTIIGAGYLVLYVLWMLVLIVCEEASRILPATVFFLLVPFMLMLLLVIFVIILFVSPSVLLISKKARAEYVKKVREAGKSTKEVDYEISMV